MSRENNDKYKLDDLKRELKQAKNKGIKDLFGEIDSVGKAINDVTDSFRIVPRKKKKKEIKKNED